MFLELRVVMGGFCNGLDMMLLWRECGEYGGGVEVSECDFYFEYGNFKVVRIFILML